MASLKFLLGMIPSTSKLEQAEKALKAEYEKLITFARSEQLARYNELSSLVNSPDFIRKKKEIETLQYKNSEPWSKEKEFLSLEKAKDMVMYFRTATGNDLKKYQSLEGSEKIKAYEELEKFIKSAAFREKEKMKPITFKDSEEYLKFKEYKSLKKNGEIKKYLKKIARGKEAGVKPKSLTRLEELEALVNSKAFEAKKNMKPITFRDTEEYKKLQDYNSRRESSEIKEFYRFGASKELANYTQVNGSKRLARFNELKAYLATPEFREQKEYLLDKKRFEKTTMYKEIQEYDKLKKDEDIIWYFKIKDSNKFDELKSWKLTFSDEFEGSSPDASKWISNYYWGEKLFGERYSVDGDLQAYTEKGNFEMKNSVLKIVTKAQKVNGKVWTADKGFTTKEFAYTSGLINTGKSFRQKYGLYTAKVRLGDPNAKSAFWMVGDTMAPHIDICRTKNGKVFFDHFNKKGSYTGTALGSRYANDFFIFSFEWTPASMVWSINGAEVFRQTTDIPQEPMYISFSGGLEKPLTGSTSMEIDWVRVYQPA